MNKLNIADEKNKEKIQTKITFDILTIFFQKCLEFAFLGDKKFEKYRNCLQHEVNLFFSQELGIKNNTDFNDTNAFDLQHIIALKVMNKKDNDYEIEGIIEDLEIRFEEQNNESQKIINNDTTSSSQEPSTMQTIGNGFANVFNFFGSPVKS